MILFLKNKTTVLRKRSCSTGQLFIKYNFTGRIVKICACVCVRRRAARVRRRGKLSTKQHLAEQTLIFFVGDNGWQDAINFPRKYTPSCRRRIVTWSPLKRYLYGDIKSIHTQIFYQQRSYRCWAVSVDRALEPKKNRFFKISWTRTNTEISIYK